MVGWLEFNGSCSTERLFSALYNNLINISLAYKRNIQICQFASYA